MDPPPSGLSFSSMTDRCGGADLSKLKLRKNV